jgi:hypothetical protein
MRGAWLDLQLHDGNIVAVDNQSATFFCNYGGWGSLLFLFVMNIFIVCFEGVETWLIVCFILWNACFVLLIDRLPADVVALFLR